MGRTARSLQVVVGVIERQDRLDRVSYRIEHVIALGFNLLGGPGRGVRCRLHGVGLGHPLHPALTDVPVGAWTTAAVLDVAALWQRRPAGGHGAGLRGAAAAGVAVGMVGACAAAATGATDWQFTDGDARRVGLVHGGLSVAATGLYGASLAQRLRGRHGRGRLLGAAGYLAMLAGTYLGGVLPFRHRVGVDHGDRALRPRDFVPVLPESELREGELRGVDADGVRVVLVRDGGQIIALGDRCAHAGGPMSEGVLTRDEIICPWHGSRYDVHTGEPTTGPATASLPCFDARIHDGRIEVRRRLPGAQAAPGAALNREQGASDARH